MALDKTYLEYLNDVERTLKAISELQEDILDEKIYVPEEASNKIEEIKNNLESYKKALSDSKKEIDDFLKGLDSRVSSSINELAKKEKDGIEKAIEKYKEYKQLLDSANQISEEIAKTNDRILALDPFNPDDIENITKEQDKVVRLQELYNKKLKGTLEIENELSAKGVSIDELEEAANVYDEIDQNLEEINDKVDEQRDKLKEQVDILIEQNKEIEKQVKAWEKTKSLFKESFNLIKKGISQIKEGTVYWRQQEGAIAKVSNTLGLSKNELSDYRKFILDATIKTQELYGISSEGLIKLQQGYDEATSRAIRFNEEQVMAQAQLSTLMGESESISYTSDLDKLGVGLMQARDLMEDIYNISKSQGVTSTKAAQDFSKNLKLAQKYNFKGGLDNLKDMTVYAAKMKMNMEGLSSLADKLSNPEGAIETAARLQVLGGTFSSLANPLAMMYESMEDMGGLAERVSDMFGNIGRFDTELGEVRINGMDRMRVKAAAEAMGMSYEEALDIVRERAKRNKIEQDVAFNTNLGKEQRDLLSTLAQFNKKRGQFEVSVFDEKTQRFESKSIAEISPEDMEKLRGDEENLDAITENTFGINAKFDKLLGTLNASAAVQQEKWFGNATRNVLEKSTEKIVNNSTLVGRLKTGYEFVKSGISITNGLLTAILAVLKLNSGIKLTGSDGALNTGSLRNKGWGGSAIASRKNLAIGGGIALASAAGSYALGSLSDNLAEKGNTEASAWASLGSSVLGGASLGSMFGPYGILIGAVVGAIWGIVSNLDELIDSVTGFFDRTLKPFFKNIGDFFSGIFNKGKGFFSSLFGGKNSEEGGNVVKVNDAIAQGNYIISNPKDSIMFAKENGPFDKMFNDVLPKIDGLYRSVKSPDLNRGNLREFYDKDSKIIKSIEKVSKNASISSNDRYFQDTVKPVPLGDTKSYFKEISEKNIVSEKPSENKVVFEKPLEVNINGTLRLESSNGSSVDILSMVKNNPILLRELTKMISDEISSSINGGRVNKSNSFVKF